MATIEPANGSCPMCGAARHKVHTLEYDMAVCDVCKHRERIKA
jgi:ribosome-binding protein aMBF1 (putative translation factor)